MLILIISFVVLTIVIALTTKWPVSDTTTADADKPNRNAYKIEVIVESTEDGVFCYHAHNSKYIAHGKTIDELNEKFKLKFEGYESIIYEDINAEPKNSI